MQSGDGSGFDLPDPLLGELKELTHLLEGVRA
jgi:hypothetical protein